MTGMNSRSLAVALATSLLLGCQGDTSQLCQLERVADGDGLDLRCNGEPVRTRLYCIDAPELGQKPWGQKSKDYLRQIIHQQVRLKTRDHDRYGRVVAEIFSADGVEQNFNLAMLAAGQAVAYRRYCEESAYLEAEQQARDYRIGVWSQPGQQQKPWKWRHRHPRR